MPTGSMPWDSKCRTFTIRDRDRTLLSLDFAPLPTRYPYTLMVSQAVTEAVLLERLRELGGDVLRPRTLVGLEQEASHVDATLDDGSQLRARYVVGAEGCTARFVNWPASGLWAEATPNRSSWRTPACAAEFPATKSPSYSRRPDSWLSLRCRWGAPHRGDSRRGAESPCAADVQALLDARGPERDPVTVESVIWGSRFRVHHRIAERYQAGRILLAGDAAHVPVLRAARE